MQKAIVFDSWSIDGKPVRFTVELGEQKIHTIVDLRTEDKKAFGIPKPGDVVWITEIRGKRKNEKTILIVGRGEIFGPSAEKTSL